MGGLLEEVEGFRQSVDELLTMHEALGSQCIDNSDPTDEIKLYLGLAASMGRPEKLPFGVSPRGAELYVAKWLEYLDFKKIEITPPRRDGGYDIEADEYLVEVKNWNRDWLPVSAVREIFGVAASMQKRSMVFSRGFLSEDAKHFAEANSIPVFLFNAEEALLEGGNSHASDLIQSRLTKKAFRIQRDISKESAIAIGTLIIEFCNRLALMVEALEAIEAPDRASFFEGTSVNLRAMAIATEEYLASLAEDPRVEELHNISVQDLNGPLSSPENLGFWIETLSANLVLEKGKNVYEQTGPLMEFISKLRNF